MFSTRAKVKIEQTKLLGGGTGQVWEKIQGVHQSMILSPFPTDLFNNYCFSLMSIPGQAPNHRTISIEKSNYTLICIVVLFFIAVIYIGKILTSHTYYMKDDLNEIRNYAGTPIYRT